MKTIDYYNQNAEQFYQSTVNVDMTDLYQPFLELVPDGGHILDAGCGSGRDSLYFIQNGYKVTAFDASENLVRLSSKLIKQNVMNLTFQELNFENQFDGIWSCASLLHVKKDEVASVILSLERSLKVNGVLYASFKYGDQEFEKDGRFFNSYNEISMTNLINCFSSLKIINLWKTEDKRIERKNDFWLNVLLQKAD